MSAGRVVLCGVAVVAIVIGGCASPEASRARSGGPGADPRNVNAEVELHGRSDPFRSTPRTKAAP